MNTSISNVLATIKENLGKVQDHLKMIQTSPSLEWCNSICVFPETGLTIYISEEGKPAITNKLFATQFAPYTAAEICKNVTNGKGEYPVIMSPQQYYSLQIEIMTSNIKILEEVI